MWLASVLEWAAAVCMALSVPLMLWQLGVGIMGLFSVRKLRKLEDKTYRFAVVSCARNEEAVIGQLLDSLQNQRYPRECFDLFVIAGQLYRRYGGGGPQAWGHRAGAPG